MRIRERDENGNFKEEMTDLQVKPTFEQLQEQMLKLQEQMKQIQNNNEPSL